MNDRLIVSTECPTCGAPLDFSEGSNAIRCDHCRSNLLLTGRKQLLSYAVTPKLNVHRAVAKALMAEKAFGVATRVVGTRLYFIPYYRVTGQDFFWKAIPSEPEGNASSGAGTAVDSLIYDNSDRSHFSIDGVGADLLGRLFEMGREVYRRMKGPPPPPKRPPAPPHPISMPLAPISPRGEEDEIVFCDRYVEKNFIACDLQQWGFYSLGVRPAVLRLELFRREVLEREGKIVDATIGPDAALAQGMMNADPQEILYRQVIGRSLSLIYFPFWIIEAASEGKKKLILIDAVSGKILRRDLPLSLYPLLDPPAPSFAPPRTVIGFRPLTCPNCGWDLPFRPEEILFFCASCEKVWQIEGNGLSELPYEIADVPNIEGPVKYLPFWRLQAEAAVPPAPARFYLPAFRYRRLKFLGDLAKALSEHPIFYKTRVGPRPELHGGYYDREDAVRLAQFTSVGMDGKREITAAAERPFSASTAALIWFPFKIEGNALRDPFTGMALPQNLLL
ncbi:MAG: hypothetical protein WAO55_14490 [Candidatus Manganitrophaceae bacterium]